MRNHSSFRQDCLKVESLALVLFFQGHQSPLVFLVLCGFFFMTFLDFDSLTIHFDELLLEVDKIM